MLDTISFVPKSIPPKKKNKPISSHILDSSSLCIEKKYALRSITNKDLKVPEKPKLKCMGFTYNGAKLFNMLPPQMRETKDSNTFKTLMKNWIWENIPSY